MKTGHGGKRAGAGKPKGRQWASTVEREALRERVRRRVARKIDPLVDAQIANALGIKFLVVRQKSTGKFLRVAEAMARNRKLNPDEELIEVWEKDPSIQAFTDLMNRTIDKPKEQEQEVKLTGSDHLLALLDAGRARNAARGQK